MANLTYRDRDNNVFQNLFDFRRDFDHIFNRFLSSGWQGGQEQHRGNMSMAAFAPAVDAFVDRDGKRFVAHVALPGVDPKDVNISVQGNMLTISGERTVSDERREADTVYKNSSMGRSSAPCLCRRASTRRKSPQTTATECSKLPRRFQHPLYHGGSKSRAAANRDKWLQVPEAKRQEAERSENQKSPEPKGSGLLHW
jgi:HSP20 family molecular chaperone IbpA